MPDSPSKPRRFIQALAFVMLALAGSGCDTQTKAWAENHLSQLPGRSMTVVSPWLEFRLAYNRGTAFSLVGDLGDARLAFALFAFALVVALFVMVVWRDRDRLQVVALGLIAGGAIGNGLDRFMSVMPGGRIGVVDFIRVNYPWGGSWPAFNIADVLVTGGAIALLVSSMFSAVHNDNVALQPDDAGRDLV